jgi:trehalose synthase-fused probable maltokinase
MSTVDDKTVVTALRSDLPALLPDFLRDRRWFAGKARKIEAIQILDVISMPIENPSVFLAMSKITYSSGLKEIYDIPLALAPALTSAVADSAQIMEIDLCDSNGALQLSDAMSEPRFLELLLDIIRANSSFAGSKGELHARAGKSFAEFWDPGEPRLIPRLNRGEQSNSSVFYGRKLILKLFRRLEPGINPDLEIGSFLTEKTSFRNIAPVLGRLEYLRGGNYISIGILQAFVANQGDAWEFTLQKVEEFFRGGAADKNAPLNLNRSILELSEREIPTEAAGIIGEYLDWAKLLGRRTAELHLALASDSNDRDFRPEAFTDADQREFRHGAEQLLRSTFQLLRDQCSFLPLDIRESAEVVLGQEGYLKKRLDNFESSHLSVTKTRIHGDYHLGQVLFTGSDFVIIDFEGEPSRPLAERRRKRSPLQDVAGMLRSFDYAAHTTLGKGFQGGERKQMEITATYWQKWVSAAFLRSYREVAAGAGFVPKSQPEFELMLEAFLLDKAVYELAYELNNRPAWVRTPLGGISQLLENAA